jgi:hypothetical protein
MLKKEPAPRGGTPRPWEKISMRQIIPPIVLPLLVALFSAGAVPPPQGAPPADGGQPSPSAGAEHPARPGPRDLVVAVRAGDRGRVRALIRAKADPNAAVEAEGRRLAPLMIALTLQDDSIINELLLAGADPATTFAGYSALDIALQLYPDDAPVIRNFLLARRTPAPPTASNDPAGVAWRANAIAALANDPARLLGLAVIAAEYGRAENRPDREAVLRRARDLSDAFQGPQGPRGEPASPG